MTFLIFDTETTGKLNKIHPLTHESQPRVVQLALELHDGKRTMGAVNILIDPGISIPEEASNIHGITTEMVKQHGVRPLVAVTIFNNLANLATCLVAHNATFDVQMLTAEYLRTGKEPVPFQQKPVLCTMLQATDVLKLEKPAKYRRPGDMYKWPNLQETYRFFIDENGFEGAHDAMADVVACRKVLFKMIDHGHIDLEKITNG